MVPTTGSLIWLSFVPLLRIALTIVCGFILAKKGLFPLAASKGFSQVVMGICLPALIFSSIVPSFNSSNINSIGPLLMTAIFYEVCGLIMAFLIREVFWVPHNFQYGILIIGALANWGNLPTAIVSSVAENDPFNPETDPALGIAYVSVFILVYNLSFFTGLYRVCAWDFLTEPPDDPFYKEPFRLRWKRRRLWLAQKLHREVPTPSIEQAHEERGVPMHELGMTSGKDVQNAEIDKKVADAAGQRPMKTRSSSFSSLQHQQRSSEMMHRLTRETSVISANSILPSSKDNDGRATFSSSTRDVSVTAPRASSRHLRLSPPPPSRPATPSRAPETETSSKGLTTVVDIAHAQADIPSTPSSPSLSPWQTVRTICSALVTPITISLILAIIIALVDPLKALLVPGVEGWSGTRVPYGPDGNPPLQFILDTAKFLAAICVPGALILLGASFARLKVPKNWGTLPIGAILAIMTSKMIILPIIGVLFIQGLSSTTSLYPSDDRILRFVGMLLSGSPAAVNQLVVTQLAAPDGGTDTLAAFLLAQYIFLFLGNTILSAVALKFVS